MLTKSIGSHNPHNVVKATINALEQLRDKAAVAEMRGLPIEKGALLAMAEGTIKIKLVRSTICTPLKHKIIVRCLGLKTLNHVAS